jgi:hypothetical protein
VPETPCWHFRAGLYFTNLMQERSQWQHPNPMTNDHDRCPTSTNCSKTQGVASHKEAASTQLSMDTLKQSFADIEAALNDIAAFRRDVLPQMARSILEMDKWPRRQPRGATRWAKGSSFSRNTGWKFLTPRIRTVRAALAAGEKKKARCRAGVFYIVFVILVEARDDSPKRRLSNA